MGFNLNSLMLFLSLALLQIEVVPLAHARETQTQLSMSLDEDRLANIDINLSSAHGTNPGYLELQAWSPLQGQGTKNGNFPSNIAHGLEIYIDGKQWIGHPTVHTSLEYEGNHGDLHYETGKIPVLNKTGELEIKLYGNSLAKYQFDPSGLTTHSTPKKLSRFQMRSFGQPGKKWASSYSYRPIYGAEGNKDLKDWTENPVFVDPDDIFSSKVDLHTHLAGAVSTNDLLEIAEKLQIPYPVSNLEAMELDYDKNAVVDFNGQKCVPFSKKNIRFTQYHSGPDARWSSIHNGLEIPPHSKVSFDRMEFIYQMRDPIVKNEKAFPLILEALAKDYAKAGVKYAELSFHSILKPEFLSMANDLVPKLEAQYGVKLRFLAGLWRHNSKEKFDSEIRLIQKAMTQSPYLVGTDFAGHETNSTQEFAETIKEVAELKKQYPDIAIRVHAGETSIHPNNIRDAIQSGATRIGHGIYGVTDEVVALAKANDVIIEFNFNSNLALENIEYLHQIRESALKYIHSGVRVTFATDGHGLYHTSPQSELAVARSLGFSDSDLALIEKSNEAYMHKMNEDFLRRTQFVPALTPAKCFLETEKQLF